MPAWLGLGLEGLDLVDRDERDDDVRPELVEGDDEQGEEDLVAQVRDLEDVLQAREQRPSSSLPMPGSPGARGYRLVSALPRAGGRPWPKGRRQDLDGPARAPRSPSRADAETAWTGPAWPGASSPRPSTLTSAPLRTQARRRQGVGRGLVAVERLEGVEVHHRVLHPERVVEALELRDALGQRELATFEAGGSCRARPGPWCHGRRSCRPCRRCRGPPGAWDGWSPRAGGGRGASCRAFPSDSAAPVAEASAAR